jgi:ribosome-binding factor A
VKAPGRRPQRVAEAIREIVAPFLQREVRDPRITGLLTITTVHVTPDLKRAVVGVAIHGDEAVRATTLEGLESAAPAVRHELGRTLPLRTVPEVVFELDRGADHAARIEAVLASLRRDEARGP